MKLYVDQYGTRFYAETVRELRKQISMGGSRVSKMYRDTKEGGCVHVGYVIGGHWLTCYVPMRNKVN
jgi:hypothetical protein